MFQRESRQRRDTRKGRNGCSTEAGGLLLLTVNIGEGSTRIPINRARFLFSRVGVLVKDRRGCQVFFLLCRKNSTEGNYYMSWDKLMARNEREVWSLLLFF